ERCVVAGGLDFGVFAEESNESGSILIHDVFLLFWPRCLSGHPKASEAAPKDKVCFFGGTAKAKRSGAVPLGWRGNRNPPGPRKRKQKTAVPPGAARPLGRQAKLCPRDAGRNLGEPKVSDRARRVNLSKRRGSTPFYRVKL